MSQKLNIIKTLNSLAKDIQIEFTIKELEDCFFFINKMDFFWKNINKNIKCIEKKDWEVTDYLTQIWGENYPFITLSKLKEISLNFYSITLNSEIIKHNSVVDDNGFIISNKKLFNE